MASKSVKEKSTEQPTRRFAVIRLRGRVGIRKPIVETLKFLRINRRYHMVLIDDRLSYQGMLQKAKDYITWGEVGAETIALLLRKRGFLPGRTHITDAIVNKYTEYKTIEKFAEAIANLSAELTDLHNIKPVFRLHPPKGGFKGNVKRPWKDKGELGYRKQAIEDLIKRMV